MDDKLKQRLVGASILVILAVVFLPWLLDGSGLQAKPQTVSLPLPSANAQEDTVTLVLGTDGNAANVVSSTASGYSSDSMLLNQDVVDATPAATQTVSVQSPSQNQTSLHSSTPSDTQTLGSTQAVAKQSASQSDLPKDTPSELNASIQAKSVASSPVPIAQSGSNTKSKPKPSDSEWVVQVGSFGDLTNANRMVKTLKDKRLVAFVKSSQTGSKMVYRVRLGPFSTRVIADKANQSLFKKTQKKGLVMGAS